MRHYEVTFIVDPVLSGDEIKATAQTYVEKLKELGGEIVHMNDMGLKQLAYPINKRTSGVYYCIEYRTEGGEIIAPLELTLRRDERVIRFLSAKLDKYGVKYNDDKRNGRIGKKKEKVVEEVREAREEERQERGRKKVVQKPRPERAKQIVNEEVDIEDEDED